MKKLDWYIVKKFIGTFFFAIMILAIIACVIDYSEKVDDFVQHKAPLWAILNYFKNFIPHITALLFPLFIFIATIFFTSKMAYRSEIIAVLASGTSFQRFLRPYFIGGGFLCLLSLLINHWIVPQANKQRLAFEDKYVHAATVVSDQNVHLRLTKDLFVYMQRYDYTINQGTRFTAEKIEGTQLKEKLSAETVNYDSVKKVWTLHDVTIRTMNDVNENMQSVKEMKMVYPFSPKDLDEDDEAKDALTTPELLRVIAREKLRGRESLNVYYVELHRRTAAPFAGLILSMIGVCIASRKIRGGSGLHLALGIVISAIYIMSMQFTTTFSIKAGLNPLMAVWIPNFIFGSLAYYLYRNQVT
jgi:lipopolysaccharide export system permease protein